MRWHFNFLLVEICPELLIILNALASLTFFSTSVVFNLTF